MNTKKIAMIFPYAPAYREPIYKLMDKELQVDWFFAGNAKRPLKLMDYSFLKRCNLSLEEKRLIGPIVKYKGLRKKDLEGYDYIISPPGIRNLSIWQLTSWFGKKKAGPKIYFWAHGWYGKENKWQTWLKKLYFSRVDGVFLYNERAKQLMNNIGLKNNLYVIYNSLDYDVQLSLRNCLELKPVYYNHFNNKNKNIVFVGRLTPVKRFNILLDAITILKKEGINVNVTFIGDGEERGALEKIASENGISSQVWFYGASYDEKNNAELIFNADLCVSPGNIGLTAMHVLMFGCPAVTNDDFNSQMPEFEAIKPGLTGDFFKAGSAESLAMVIKSWFLNHNNDRGIVRTECYNEIDKHWNPHYQLNIIKKAFNI